MSEFNETYIERNIGELCEEYDKIKGANTNIARITPDLIDGLTRVQRRTLYIMFLKDNGEKFRKVATIDGEVIGRVHPHGQSSVYEALVKKAQWWNNSIPLIEGDGNFGSISGDCAGADRYIKARLSKYTISCFFEDWDKSVVDSVMAFDEETKEPIYLPAKYPNVLLNGCIGIGYGLSSNIPCFNFREVVEACIKLISNPDANIILIPDSPTGADIIETDFAKMCNKGRGKYSMRCGYEIDNNRNIIKITSIPYKVTVNSIIEKIADIKENHGLPELIDINDNSGKVVDLDIVIRDDINPYKFMKKLIKEVPDIEKSYPVNVTVVNGYETYDYSIKELILGWIEYRREQKRVSISHERTSLMTEQRTIEVKIFVTNENNLNETIHIFRSSRNRAEVERRLIDKYKNSEIKMDSIQARALSNLRLVEISMDACESYRKRAEELKVELAYINELMNVVNGVDKVIVAELREGIKKFGTPRKSNVVPQEISISSEVAGVCILQLSSDGMINRRIATNADEEPIPIDNNGFALKVDNDSTFVIIDDKGLYSFVKVNELPVDSEVPVNRFCKQLIGNNIVALLPFDIDSNMCCTLISKFGMLKRIRISDITPTRKPCINLSSNDNIVRGIATYIKSKKDLLIYTKDGMGQRFDPNNIRITSPIAKGLNGFKLNDGDEIVGCYMINPEENQYILYVTVKGKMRLNNIDFLPTRDSKHDDMVSLISLNDRDKLLGVVGCNKYDKLQVFFDDGSDEIIDISKMPESTMSADPKKMTSKNAVTTNIVKVKLL